MAGLQARAALTSVLRRTEGSGKLPSPTEKLLRTKPMALRNFGDHRTIGEALHDPRFDRLRPLPPSANAGDHLDAAKLRLAVNRMVDLTVKSILLHRTRSPRDPRARQGGKGKALTMFRREQAKDAIGEQKVLGTTGEFGGSWRRLLTARRPSPTSNRPRL